MNFEDLYSRLFVKEAQQPEEQGDVAPEIGYDDLSDETDFDEIEDNTPTPDKYDVEPMPIPKNTSNSVNDLQGYVDKLQEFLKVLNGTSGDSLQKFVISAERQNSLLQGIADDTADDITKLAGQLATLVQTLNGFVNMAERRKRELAVAASQV